MKRGVTCTSMLWVVARYIESLLVRRRTTSIYPAPLPCFNLGKAPRAATIRYGAATGARSAGPEGAMDRSANSPQPAPTVPVIPGGRDLRLDLFRGLALWLIFLDHIPNNIVSWLTIRNYGF